MNNKLEKPRFFTTPIWGNISIVFGIIITFSFGNKLSDIHLLIIISLLIFSFLLWNLIKYIINWNKLYKDYLKFYQKFTELDNRYDMRLQELDDKDLLISEYEKFIENLNVFILTALTKNTSAEIEQLKNMQTFLYLSVEHLNKLKGVNDNGRSLQSRKDN